MTRDEFFEDRVRESWPDYRERFGTFDQWTLGELEYLHNELMRGHWEDSDESGSGAAAGGLSMAISAELEDASKDEIAKGVLNGLWLAVDWITRVWAEEDLEPLTWITLKEIWKLTNWTAKPGFGVGWAPCNPIGEDERGR